MVILADNFFSDLELNELIGKRNLGKVLFREYTKRKLNENRLYDNISFFQGRTDFEIIFTNKSQNFLLTRIGLYQGEGKVLKCGLRDILESELKLELNFFYSDSRTISRFLQ